MNDANHPGDTYNEFDDHGINYHSRGYLPHIEGQELIQHITFHLADSIPEAMRTELETKLQKLPHSERDQARSKRLEQWLDAGFGSCILREPAVARMMCATLLHFENERYEMHAWVVMPNHVHVMLQPKPGWTIRKIAASWKKFSARQIRDIQKQGIAQQYPAELPVWHREFWDRFIRDEEHYGNVRAYIEQNPVKARLCAEAEQWPWESAHQPTRDRIRGGRSVTYTQR